MSVMPLRFLAKYSPFFCLPVLSVAFCASSARAQAPAVVIDAQQVLGTGYNSPAICRSLQQRHSLRCEPGHKSDSCADSQPAHEHRHPHPGLDRSLYLGGSASLGSRCQRGSLHRRYPHCWPPSRGGSLNWPGTEKETRSAPRLCFIPGRPWPTRSPSQSTVQAIFLSAITRLATGDRGHL